MMAKIDYKQEMKELFRPSAKTPSVVDVPAMNFLVIDGSGDPNGSPEFEAAVEALYGLSYAIKFAIKKQGGPDYTVMPLEGLWWNPRKRAFNWERDEWDWSEWKWTLMIAQPTHVTDGHVRSCRAELGAKKNPEALDRVRFREFEEGLSVQVMHIGPFSEEGPTVTRLHDFAADNGYRLRGKHHEIYLSDPRRAKPEKMKTVLRHPVSPRP